MLVALVAFVIPTCSATTPSGKEAQAVETSASLSDKEPGSNAVQMTDALKPDEEGLVELLGQESASKLIEASEDNDDALWIAAHPDEYALDGEEVQYKILKLAADEPEAISYVREFPEKYPASDQVDDASLAMETSSPSEDAPDTAIPHLYQWDRRWAQTVYCSTTFGLTGCGPTTMAMIYQGLTGDDSLTPYDMGQLAQQKGYMEQFDGTDFGFFTDVADELGLEYSELTPTAETITSELQGGHVIITNLAPGYFTRYGHFFVLAGLDDDGKVIVNDPYSVVRSSQTWDADFIADESRIMYSYSA